MSFGRPKSVGPAWWQCNIICLKFKHYSSENTKVNQINIKKLYLKKIDDLKKTIMDFD